MTIAALVLPLGLDTLAVALALGLRGMEPLRPALWFTLFETVMPLIGIAAGWRIGARRGYGGARRTPPGAIWKYAGCCTQRPSV